MYTGGIRIKTKSKPIIISRVNSKTLGEVSVIIAIKNTPKNGSNRTNVGTIFLIVITCRNFDLLDLSIFGSLNLSLSSSSNSSFAWLFCSFNAEFNEQISGARSAKYPALIDAEMADTSCKFVDLFATLRKTSNIGLLLIIEGSRSGFNAKINSCKRSLVLLSSSSRFFKVTSFFC
ncbi:hypothetical protein ES707_19128 [subsurface metagenome]